MKAIITHEQLHMKFTPEINQYLGYTDEILNNACFSDGITLNDCYVGQLTEREDGRYEVSLNIANANKLPRRVAIRDINQNDLEFWKSLVGEENIVTI